MKFLLTLCLAGLVTAGAIAPAAAQQDCYDLWYERNPIYAENGFCFSTDMARQVFAGYDCWTKNPRLTGYEQDRVAAIQAEERRRGCRVNR